MNKKQLFVFFTLFALLGSSCSASSDSASVMYLNRNYFLKQVYDIYDYNPASPAVPRIDWVEPNKPYSYLFDLNSCYMNFNCKGTNYYNFHCEMDFRIVASNGEEVLKYDSVDCYYATPRSQEGVIVIKDKTISDAIGTIYVYTPYWCRWQLEYDVDNSGNKTLLTFEFWKGAFNSLPDFANNVEE